ncbi:DUF4347 domain-containing protein, partial [Rhizobiaceae bacterium]|nr:DUF4347 domain-containing protein [Rhizobiaceae bacterium]
MARPWKSILKAASARMTPVALPVDGVAPPVSDRPHMRALEPRILLDAAAVETALDIAGQAAHSSLADDYVANMRAVETLRVSAETADSLELSVDESPEPAPAEAPLEIIFVDAGVEDRETLLADFGPDTIVHVLDADRDGVEQIAERLAADGAARWSAVHILSHGAEGRLALGDAVLDEASMLGGHADALARISATLSDDADILLYGCEFASGTIGSSAVEALALATGADIAASEDKTGSSDEGGDWALEVQRGAIEAVTFTAPAWSGILPGFELAPLTEPVVTHLGGGTIGTVGTSALFEGAATLNGTTYDVRATLVGGSDNANATFGLADDGMGGTIDDFRVTVTNLGTIVDNVAGEPVREEASVAVLYEITSTVDGSPAPEDVINLVMGDIDGLGGQIGTRDTVGGNTDQLWSYTVDAASTLGLEVDEGLLLASGTETGDNAIGSRIGLHYARANSFVILYATGDRIATFDLDGDGDITFDAPVETDAQHVDLNGADAGFDYTAEYLDGSRPGVDEDVPLSIAASDMEIFDLDNSELLGGQVVLTDLQPGDMLNVNDALMLELGIDAFVSTSAGPPASMTVDLFNFASAENYETAIRSITFSNGSATPSTADRHITVSTFDVNVDSRVSTTIITFGTAAGGQVVTGQNIYVAQEDTAIVVAGRQTDPNLPQGLVDDDSDASGGMLDVVGATDALGNSITIGVDHTTPFGATLRIESDGSVSYMPAPNRAGSETITYTASNGAVTAEGTATFFIQANADPLIVDVIQPQPVSAEDATPSYIDLRVSTLDTDGSETQNVVVRNVPIGAIVTDGTNEFIATLEANFTNITAWDLSQITVLPVQNDDRDITLRFDITNTDADGSMTFASRDVTFQIDAVADQSLVEVFQGGGEIDATVSLANLIIVELFDTDGSEIIDEISIANIPVGGDILLSGVAMVQNAGRVTFTADDIANLSFSPPITGVEQIYDMLVGVVVREANAENGGLDDTAVRENIVLRIDLNSRDDEVYAFADFASTSAGDSVLIAVLENDFIPDGGERVTRIDGQVLNTSTDVVLAGGQGIVQLTAFGELRFVAASTFSGDFTFIYEVTDIDGSTDTAPVHVSVQSSWNISGPTSVQEGDIALYDITLGGRSLQGSTSSVEVNLTDLSGDGDDTDFPTLQEAVDLALLADPDSGFSFEAGRLSYTAPAQDYTIETVVPSPAFIDISGGSTTVALGHGSEDVTRVDIGFTFPVYDRSFTEVFIATDGYV